MIIVGASRFDNTNIVMNVITLMENTFNKVYIYTKNESKPLYEYLEMAIPDSDLLEIHAGIARLNIIYIDEHYFGRTLTLFNDLVQENNQTKNYTLEGERRVFYCIPYTKVFVNGYYHKKIERELYNCKEDCREMGCIEIITQWFTTC